MATSWGPISYTQGDLRWPRSKNEPVAYHQPKFGDYSNPIKSVIVRSTYSPYITYNVLIPVDGSPWETPISVLAGKVNPWAFSHNKRRPTTHRLRLPAFPLGCEAEEYLLLCWALHSAFKWQIIVSTLLYPHIHLIWLILPTPPNLNEAQQQITRNPKQINEVYGIVLNVVGVEGDGLVFHTVVYS